MRGNLGEWKLGRELWDCDVLYLRYGYCNSGFEKLLKWHYLRHKREY